MVRHHQADRVAGIGLHDRDRSQPFGEPQRVGELLGAMPRVGMSSRAVDRILLLEVGAATAALRRSSRRSSRKVSSAASSPSSSSSSRAGSVASAGATCDGDYQCNPEDHCTELTDGAGSKCQPRLDLNEAAERLDGGGA